MAIHAYVGKPGHGKSYGVVEHVIIPSLKQDRHVVTNIPLSIDDLLSTYGGNITQLPDNWFELDDLSEIIPPGSVAIIDECWRRWPAGKNVNQANLTDKSLLAEHRHRVDDKNNSMRVVLVTQDLAQISSWVRLLIETTYRIRKITKKTFKVDIYNGAVTGDAPSKTKLIRSTAGTFKSSVYSFYKSATQSNSGGVGDESSADGRSSILRSFGLWGALGSFVVCIVLGVFFVKKFFTTDQPGVKHPASVSAPKQSSAPAEPPISTTWRLVGFVHPSKPDASSKVVSEALALVADNNGNTRYISFSHCRYFPDFTEAYCLVDGFKITNWSLKKPNPITGGLIGSGL
ncbi:zonular occludens toxin domain-containing protein [Pseudomonas prosekii]|uniref:Zona occludens toxin n=1 Tax=Pseudomonas prosekii TaxID=1148509 RepID=A0A1H2BVV8_9PSED|nr:zonular occludens toxin domain-containing protein [Pseudomonas prosekii]SDT62358.1 zona occludens toxin [Pseudomonas prosekii]SDT62469.1 zona occludens toxin [Pseudomonas prosekii]